MKYSKVHIGAIGYELPAQVVTSDDIEARLAPLYAKLHIPEGQLEALTGVYERRWWPRGFRLSDGAIAAARRALASAGLDPADLGAVIYAGVCREGFEPATACRVASEIGAPERAAVYDISNACLGVLNGMLDIANRIELGQIRAGLVVSCESAREINEDSIDLVLKAGTMEVFREALATFTGGCGAVAVLLTDAPLAKGRRRLLGGVERTAPEHHDLCRWGLNETHDGHHKQYLTTDAVNVLKHGVALGSRTWAAFLAELGWEGASVDKTVCHQVGQSNRDAILGATGIPAAKDYPSFPFLGNMGTVSLPLTAGLAEERGFLSAGDRVAFLGIGSGLNCLMLGWDW